MDLRGRHHQTTAKSAGKANRKADSARPMRDYKEIASHIADEFGANATYVEDLLRQFQHNPNSVDAEWGEYFQSLLGGDDSVKVESATGVKTAQATAQAAAERPAPV